MARRKDPPQVQKEKGFPSRRRGKTEAELARVKAAAQALADAPKEDAGPWSPPSHFTARPKGGPVVSYAREIEIWREIVPILKANGLAEAAFRPVVARYCITQAKFERLELELRSGAYTQAVGTVAGGSMIRKHPIVDIAADVEDQLNYYAEQLGFTPKTFYPIMRDSFAKSRQGELLLSVPAPAVQPETTSLAQDPFAVLDGYDSPPPARHN